MTTSELGRGIARRWGFVVAFTTIFWTDARAAVVLIEEPPAERAGEPSPPAPPGAGEMPKVECFTRHGDAQVARLQGRLLDARAALRICSRESCPPAIRADCVDWLEPVGRSLPSVVVTARARGADLVDVKVLIDGKLVAERLSGAALEIDPGVHRFRFESPRWPVVERDILVSEGVKGRPIDVEFAPPETDRRTPAPPALPTPPSPASPEPPASRRLHTIDYVLGSVVLASLGTFATFGGSALEERRQLQERCAPFCTDDDVSPLRTQLLVADVALGVAVASLAVGLYLYVARPPDPRSNAQASTTGLSLVGDATKQGARFGVTGAF